MMFDAEVLRVLADPLRARIVELLAVEALCTCHLVEETGARQSNVSNHLRLLREAGLVDSESHGRFTYYRLRPDVLDGLARGIAAVAEQARTTTEIRRPC
ncbi:ArsR/SmtB family transcription factor [Umezawaea beigongshangensis]|uniref:ArsR/SmtB family transcription factor n=1 Tax=Umezawaea beigongshangensis TaxID=2780383 RepID=UPI0018F140A6|nr:metalloregulator ArsR/SmtB family transcription factor [Umezawaea beigongshangensis]